MNLDLILRLIMALALLVAAGAWAWAMVAQPKARPMTATRQRLVDRVMLGAVGLLVIGTILGLISSDRWNAGGIVLAVLALNGWAQERQQRGVPSENPTVERGQ